MRKYACDMCDKLFFEPDKVRKHKRFVHLKLRNYRCDECGDTFRDLKMVGFHIHHFKLTFWSVERLFLRILASKMQYYNRLPSRLKELVKGTSINDATHIIINVNLDPRVM